MKKAFTGYIQFVYKLDKKNTVLFLILNFLTSLFIGVETIIIAKLIDNIKCNYEDLRVVFINVGCLFAAWGVKRIIEYRTAQRGAVLRKTMNERIPNRMVEVKSKIPYATLEKTEIQELIYRVEENGEAQFAEYFYNTIFLIVCVMEMGWLLSVIAVKEIWIALLMLLIVVPYVFFAVKNGKLGYEAYEKSEEAFRRAEYYQSVICNRANVEE